MSGAMRRIGEYLGLLEDTGRYDEYDGQYDASYDAPEGAPEAAGHRPVQEAAPTGAPRRAEAGPAPVADLAERRRTAPAAAAAGPRVAPVAVTNEVAELSRITTLHPRTYNEARTVGENFREGTPVIMNLSEMDDNDAKRLVDFAAGLVFATRGTIERITNKVFLLSPANVSVAAEDKQRIVEGGFFNQS